MKCTKRWFEEQLRRARKGNFRGLQEVAARANRLQAGAVLLGRRRPWVCRWLDDVVAAEVWASVKRDAPLLAWLRSHWAWDPNLLVWRGDSLFHEACKDLRVGAVRAMLRDGANPLALDCFGRSPREVLGLEWLWIPAAAWTQRRRRRRAIRRLLALYERKAAQL